MKQNPQPANETKSPPASAKPASVWQFVNSSFGLFLLSSVFLGLLSFSYGQWRDHTSRNQKIEQLDLEIALRLQAMEQMSTGVDNIRYSNLVNILSVMNGEMNGESKSSFYVRKPLFEEFENKNLASLLWQLDLLVPVDRHVQIKSAIREVNIITDDIRQVRFHAANDLDDERPKPRTKKEEDKRDDEDDKFKKDYGQSGVYRHIHSLSQTVPWKDLTA